MSGIFFRILKPIFGYFFSCFLSEIGTVIIIGFFIGCIVLGLKWIYFIFLLFVAVTTWSLGPGYVCYVMY